MTDAELQALIKQVTDKRPRTVLEHIVKHGYITTEDLKERYGYNHPPRAAKDVRDQGIPLETFRVAGSDGRRIAAYRLGDPANADPSRIGGRAALPKVLKDALIAKYGPYCAHCHGHYPSGRGLQVDHRVPYQIGGDPPISEIDEYMLLCGSCNRSKSFTCENCPNWTTMVSATCETCMWASPEDYSHIATEQRRQLTVAWDGPETKIYDRFEKTAERVGMTPDQLLKKLVKELK